MDAPNHHAHHPGFAGATGFLAALTMVLGRGGTARLAAQLTGLGEGDNLVDVGCGPGAAARLAARRGATVIGVDPAPVMLRVGRFLSRRVRYVEGTAEELPLEDASATVLWSLATVHHWADVDAGLNEAARVLRPGGRFLVIEKRTRAGATGRASHGWTREQAEAFAERCRHHRFEHVSVGEHQAGRRSSLSVLATWKPGASSSSTSSATSRRRHRLARRAAARRRPGRHGHPRRRRAAGRARRHLRDPRQPGAPRRPHRQLPPDPAHVQTHRRDDHGRPRLHAVLFGDWEHEDPLESCSSIGKEGEHPPPLDAAGVAQRMARAAEIVDHQMRFWNEFYAVVLETYEDMNGDGERYMPRNDLNEPSRAGLATGGLQSTNVYSGGVYELGPDEALVIEVRTPVPPAYAGFGLSTAGGVP